MEEQQDSTPLFPAGRGTTGFVIKLGGALLAVFGLFYVVHLSTRPSVDEASANLTRNHMNIIAMAIDTFRIENGHLPAIEEMDQIIMAPGVTWPLTDAWGNPYHYQRDSQRPEGFELTSFGSDGAPGGKGLAADITFAQAEADRRQAERDKQPAPGLPLTRGEFHELSAGMTYDETAAKLGGPGRDLPVLPMHGEDKITRRVQWGDEDYGCAIRVSFRDGTAVAVSKTYQ